MARCSGPRQAVTSAGCLLALRSPPAARQPQEGRPGGIICTQNVHLTRPDEPGLRAAQQLSTRSG
ncbi:hypothetical protein E2C01_028501 [Portunus trituberculatus]|uniref:Uncharacterized protein n=1 Tax=Portunus trituberculatus TaxID=210409 RepID=A0A5B7EPA0_PORTR|nr:hypothetical protein [Portunus trituberculatus]